MTCIERKKIIANNGIALLRKLPYSRPRKPLSLINTAFLQTYLDNCDDIYNKLHNEKFKYTIKLIQYDASLAITGVIKRTISWRLVMDVQTSVSLLKIYHQNFYHHPSVTSFYVSGNNSIL